MSKTGSGPGALPTSGDDPHVDGTSETLRRYSGRVRTEIFFRLRNAARPSTSSNRHYLRPRTHSPHAHRLGPRPHEHPQTSGDRPQNSTHLARPLPHIDRASRARHMNDRQDECSATSRPLYRPESGNPHSDPTSLPTLSVPIHPTLDGRRPGGNRGSFSDPSLCQ